MWLLDSTWTSWLHLPHKVSMESQCRNLFAQEVEICMGVLAPSHQATLQFICLWNGRNKYQAVCPRLNGLVNVRIKQRLGSWSKYTSRNSVKSTGSSHPWACDFEAFRSLDCKLNKRPDIRTVGVPQRRLSYGKMEEFIHKLQVQYLPFMLVKIRLRTVGLGLSSL